ncbi:hypothetical protein J2S42_003342 [Catenuloplanes indicus]|uniref:Uncharacterized protein n=1 Tax=Catenuloplanes indicus TaxID=137267 RepID=A0AAE3VYP5_9ACTN|nr:hypothetical protein [Catenuloplanes indicus]
MSGVPSISSSMQRYQNSVSAVSSSGRINECDDLAAGLFAQ